MTRELNIKIHPIQPGDRDWISSLLTERWGSSELVSRGVLYRGDQLPGFIAWTDEKRCGLATYNIQNNECELVSLDSLDAGRGIGTALLKTVIDTAGKNECRRLWLITTNDNLPALRFYQRRGLELVAVHRRALVHSRTLKPSIPLTGLDDIPLRDEIELERIL